MKDETIGCLALIVIGAVIFGWVSFCSDGSEEETKVSISTNKPMDEPKRFVGGAFVTIETLHKTIAPCFKLMDTGAKTSDRDKLRKGLKCMKEAKRFTDIVLRDISGDVLPKTSSDDLNVLLENIQDTTLDIVRLYSSSLQKTLTGAEQGDKSQIIMGKEDLAKTVRFRAEISQYFNQVHKMIESLPDE